MISGFVSLSRRCLLVSKFAGRKSVSLSATTSVLVAFGGLPVAVARRLVERLIGSPSSKCADGGGPSSGELVTVG